MRCLSVPSDRTASLKTTRGMIQPLSQTALDPAVPSDPTARRLEWLYVAIVLASRDKAQCRWAPNPSLQSDLTPICREVRLRHLLAPTTAMRTKTLVLMQAHQAIATSPWQAQTGHGRFPASPHRVHRQDYCRTSVCLTARLGALSVSVQVPGL